jgi:3-phosphoshikimate 1-carboxyvinyltransferase
MEIEQTDAAGMAEDADLSSSEGVPAVADLAGMIDGSGTLTLHRAKKLRGSVSFPGDAHQALYVCAIASLSPEATRIGNLPEAEWFSTYRASLEALGVVFEATDDGHMLVRGPREGLTTPPEPLVVRHEIAALILAGLCSGRGLNATLLIDDTQVPGDIIAQIKSLWPQTAADADGVVIGALNVKARGIVKPFERKWDDGATKVALLFHALAGGESLELHLRRQGADLLENMLAHFEVPLKVERDDDKEADELTRRIARQMRAAGKEVPVTRLKLGAGARPAATFLTLAGDVTEASAVALAATLVKGSDVLLEHVLLNTGRAAFFAALRRLGGDIEVTQRRERFGETQGTVRVRTSDLMAKRFDGESLADVRDEIFMLITAAAYAEGESVFRDLDWLRQGPEDRLRVFTAALKRGGVETGEIEDGIVIRGRAESDGAAFDSLGHCGLAAACTVMALKSHGASTLDGAAALAWRHPGLLTRFNALEHPATGSSAEKTT